MALMLEIASEKGPTKNKLFFTSSFVKISYHIHRDRVCSRFLKVVIFYITGKFVNSGSQFLFASRQCYLICMIFHFLYFVKKHQAYMLEGIEQVFIDPHSFWCFNDG